MTQSIEISLVLIGPGLVGSEFLQQVRDFQENPTWPVALKVVGIANSKKMVQGDFPLGEWQKLLENGEKVDLKSLLILGNEKGPKVVVDCTSSQWIAEQYLHWMELGWSVITPNKKAFSGTMDLWNQLFKKALENRVSCLHESTVGAGLPIISTLKDLVASGDRIDKIEGIFSGTLSYLFNTFSHPSNAVQHHETLSFSQIVSIAKKNGYTEPDPRDDLNGMDVARKVVILSRIMGLNIEINDLKVENIVPLPLQKIESVDEFMTQLPGVDSHFESMNQEALRSQSVLRYVGSIDSQGCAVSLKKYPFSHPFANLKGSDNIIAITTRRFPSPLIIQGAGAGAAVTAFGMFSDLLKLIHKTV